MSLPTSTTGTRGAAHVQPQALMRLRSLELRAKVVVEGFWNGLHRSPYHGFSVEFTEYRQYTRGDDPKHLDWRVFARSDRYFIRKFEDETNLRCHLVADLSRSMSLASKGISKADYAATLAATFAWLLYLQGDAIGLMTFDNVLREFLPARHRPDHIRQVFIALEKPPRPAPTDIVGPLQKLIGILKKRGMVVLFSDFLAPIDRLETTLTSLTACGHEVAAFQILDPAEVAFSYDQPCLFEDLETGRTLLIEPSAVRDRYLEKFHAHQKALQDLTRKLGVRLHTLTTDDPMDRALGEFVQDRSRPGRRSRPNRGGAGNRGGRA